MGGDYPDWTRLFYLTGTAITIPITIKASDVWIPITLEAAHCGVNVGIVASSVTLNIRITSSAVTLNVNITSQTANINFTFADQSVAVFDAAKWFAHNAQQVFVRGDATPISGIFAAVATRTVPADHTYFVTYLSGGCEAAGPAHVGAYLVIDGSWVLRVDDINGVSTILDTPVRATAGSVVALWMAQWSGAAVQVQGGLGGYDEVD